MNFDQMIHGISHVLTGNQIPSVSRSHEISSFDFLCVIAQSESGVEFLIR